MNNRAVKKYRFVLFVTALILVLALTVLSRFTSNRKAPLGLYSTAISYERRSDDLTVNITGRLNADADRVEYRLNDGPYHGVSWGKPRLRDNDFIVELLNEDLIEGKNIIKLRVIKDADILRILSHQFHYSREPLALPTIRSWERSQLDIQDGWWQKVKIDSQTWVGPVSGSEDYDRLLLVTGAINGGRRAEVDFIVKPPLARFGKNPFGVGIVILWGGHQDTKWRAQRHYTARPRNGWIYGIGWYYSRGGGFGVTFGNKDDEAQASEHSDYQTAELIPGARYHLVVEAHELRSADGKYGGFRLRLRVAAPNALLPKGWIETESEGHVDLPERPYAVALLAHRAAVVFGPVRIDPLAPMLIK